MPSSSTLLAEAFGVIGSLESRGIHPAIAQIAHLLASAIEAHRTEVETAVGHLASAGVDLAEKKLEAV